MPLPLPAEFRREVAANLRLAGPLIAAQIAGIGMGAVDTVFAGRLGSRALAAVAMGFNLNLAFFVFFMGLLMACSPIVAHRVGAGGAAGVRGFAARARGFALVSALVWMLGLNLVAAPVLTRLGLDAQTARQSIAFTRFVSGSAWGMSLWFALRFCAEGLGRTRPIFLAAVAGLAVNAALDWLLLFPHAVLNALGLPCLGAPGCGVATTLASLAMAGLLALQLRQVPELRNARPSSATAVPEGAAAILRLGVPIGLMMLAEAGMFIVVGLMTARFGDTTVAAYQVAINFSALVFMIPLGLALATTVRVGQAVGAGAWALARRRGYLGMALGLGNAFSNALVMVLLGGGIATLYTGDRGVAARAAGFLLLAAAFQLFDGLQATANGALRGYKDTRLPALVTLVAYWLVGLPLAWWLAFHTRLGADGLWWGLSAGLAVAACGLSLRYRVLARRTPSGSGVPYIARGGEASRI